MKLDAKIPEGSIEKKWENRKFENKLVNPANRRKYKVIVVGTGLAGASAAASLAEQGYHVQAFCFHESPRRAHSIAAQGGINAAKNYQNDGDSVYRLFYDTARGQPGQQLLLGAYSALERQAGLKTLEISYRHEMLDLVVVDGRARGIVARNLETGELTTHAADAVLLATGGYGNVFYLSTNAKYSNATAAWRAHKRGALFANPCFTQIHPTCIPVSGDYQSKLTLMSESLRNDGRVWVPKNKGDKRPPAQIPEDERDYYLERIYPAFGNLVPRDVASRAAKYQCDQGRGVGPSGLAVYLDFKDAIKRVGHDVIASRYGNLFQMYDKITGDNPYETPMRIYPAVHYTMGGLWVDYNLMSTIPGLFVTGEANFSDHGANRLGASALMQGLADGYFVAPYCIANYLGGEKLKPVKTSDDSFKASVNEVQSGVDRLLKINGKQTVDEFHRKLGHIMWDKCGMARNEAGLKQAIGEIRQLREQFWQDVKVPGSGADVNQELEKAGRVADFIELGELMCIDALERRESCGGHFREEMQTSDGEAQRDDDKYAYVAAWEYAGAGKPEALHKEPLAFDNIHLAQRSYK
ncbi:MAG: fumarate reductase/succinate dehydrogenase flavoprotein subunit [Deltaproteobacteria bacterium]|nr:fumarate reductase/succinate dehydrogenase flavoprotein subunit [Deltaproteobacteria bacterium]